MKKKLAVISVLMLALVSVSFAFSIDGNIYSAGVTRYLWRGLDLNDNGPAIQPGLSLSAEGATVEIWSSCQQYATPDLFDEIDIYANYEHTIPYAEFLTIGVGYASYIVNPTSTYPFLETSDEINVTLKSDVISNPYITWDHSIDANVTYNYLEAGVSYEYSFGEVLGGNVAAGAEANVGMHLDQITGMDKDTFEPVRESKLTVAGLNIYASYEVAGFTVTPSFYSQLSLCDTRSEEGAKLYNNLAAGSLMVNYNFTIGQKDEPVKEEPKTDDISTDEANKEAEPAK